MIEAIEEQINEIAPASESASEDIDPSESLVTIGAAIVASLVSRQMLRSAWRLAKDSDPPEDPSADHIDWKDAILWGALSGAAVGVTRIAMRRMSTSAYRKFQS